MVRFMTSGPYDPEAEESGPRELTPCDREADEAELLEPASREPDETPPVDLWSAVGDIQPWVTVVIVLAWALVFMVLAIRHEIRDTSALLAWGANAIGLGRLDSAWRLLASTFVHAGAAHVFFNAISMLVLGPAVERIFTGWGFCLLYAAGGAGASFASLARYSRSSGCTFPRRSRFASGTAAPSCATWCFRSVPRGRRN